MCPHTTTCALILLYRRRSEELLECVRILLYMCPHTTICVRILLYICSHTTIHMSSGEEVRSCPNVSAYHYIYMSSYYYICVVIRRCMCPQEMERGAARMCPHTTIYMSSGEEARGCPKKKRLSTWGAGVNSGNEGVVGVGGYVCPHDTAIYVLLILLYMRLALLYVSWPHYYLSVKLGQRNCGGWCLKERRCGGWESSKYAYGFLY